MLGYQTAFDLSVLIVVCSIEAESQLENEYSEAFTGLGKMKGTEVKLYLDDTVHPVKKTHRRVPYHQRKALENCLDYLVQEDIIEESKGPTPMEKVR